MNTCELRSIVSWLRKRVSDDVISLLESAQFKLERIQQSLEAAIDLPSPEVILSTYVDTATESIAAAENVLTAIQESFYDKSDSPDFPSSQTTTEDLNRINHILDLLETPLNQIWMIGDSFRAKVRVLEGRTDEMRLG